MMHHVSCLLQFRKICSMEDVCNVASCSSWNQWEHHQVKLQSSPLVILSGLLPMLLSIIDHTLCQFQCLKMPSLKGAWIVASSPPPIQMVQYLLLFRWSALLKALPWTPYAKQKLPKHKLDTVIDLGRLEMLFLARVLANSSVRPSQEKGCAFLSCLTQSVHDSFLPGIIDMELYELKNEAHTYPRSVILCV